MNDLKNKTKGHNITFKPGSAIIPDFDLVQTKIPIETPILISQSTQHLRITILI